jgi:hypothetical protein
MRKAPKLMGLQKSLHFADGWLFYPASWIVRPQLSVNRELQNARGKRDALPTCSAASCNTTRRTFARRLFRGVAANDCVEEMFNVGAVDRLHLLFPRRGIRWILARPRSLRRVLSFLWAAPEAKYKSHSSAKVAASRDD